MNILSSLTHIRRSLSIINFKSPTFEENYNYISVYKRLRIKLKNNLLQYKLKRSKKYFNYSSLESAKNLVLVVDSIIPEFDKDSGSRRLYNIIKLMVKHGYDVALMSNKKPYKYDTTYAPYYRDMGVMVYEPSLDQNSKLIDNEGFVKIVSKFTKFAWLHRPDIFKKYNSYFDGNTTKLIFDMVDFHYLRLNREWQTSKNSKTKIMADQCLEMELDNCTKAHCVLAISQQDKIALVQYFKAEEKISVLSNIHQFKNIDGLPPDKRKDLLFVGGFDHKPNMDAVAYLHQEIMPALWTIFPDLKITIVGSNPTPELLALNESRFRVLGYVEDLEPLFKSSRLFVAPLRYGAGVKGKIGQSLEYGLPVVTTSIGAEGFEFSSITNYSVADDTQQFVECITELISNDPLWVTVQQASDSILAPFSIKTTQSNLLNILGD